MANIKSQKKRIITNEKRRVRNQAVRSHMRTMMKIAIQAIDTSDSSQIGDSLPKALSAIDKAAKKGVIHRNSAARKKSLLQHRAAVAQSPQA